MALICSLGAQALWECLFLRACSVQYYTFPKVWSHSQHPPPPPQSCALCQPSFPSGLHEPHAPAPTKHSRVTAASSCPKCGVGTHGNLQQGQNLFQLPKAGSRNVWDTSLYTYPHLKLCSICLYPKNATKKTHTPLICWRHCKTDTAFCP